MNEKTYAGIIETYSIYREQPGDIQIPAVQLGIPYANSPPKSTIAYVSLPVFRFHADLPAEARGLDYFLPTIQLTMRQKWSRSLKSLHAGDTIERTITISAAKMQAMLIPPLPVSCQIWQFSLSDTWCISDRRLQSKFRVGQLTLR